MTWYKPVYQVHLASYSSIIQEPNTNNDYEPYTMHSTIPGDTNTDQWLTLPVDYRIARFHDKK
jgi:hypothetical protein